MKILRAAVIFVFMGLLVLAGCQQSPLQGNITDDLGRTIQIKDNPQRIISLSPSNTEIVYALGLENQLIGVTTYCNYPPQVKDKPKVSEFSKVDVEKIVSLQPDLILADSIHKSDVIPALEKLRMTVLALDPPDLDKVIGDIELIGKASGKIQEAGILVSGLQGRAKKITDKTVQLSDSEKPRILFLTWHDPLWTAGNNTMINDLINRSGGSNIAKELDGFAIISLEAVLDKNPQIIIVMSSMGDKNNTLNYVNTEPRFQSTDALKNKKVYVIESDIFGRTTPRTVDALEQLAKIIHPELFK
jgi:iron complex transport system substrate-binding protein